MKTLKQWKYPTIYVWIIWGGNVFPEVSKWYQNQPDGYICFGNMLYKYKGEMPENSVITSFPAGLQGLQTPRLTVVKTSYPSRYPTDGKRWGKAYFRDARL